MAHDRALAHKPRPRLALRQLAAAGAVALTLAALPAHAQQQPEWFVPGQQPGQRPPAGQRPAGTPPPRSGTPPAQAPRPPGRTEAPPPLPAGQQPPAAVVGIVDIPEVQRVSAAFNNVREEIERRRQRLNEDLQREQNSWREQQQALANQRASMPPDALRQRERDLQDRITDSQRIFRERSRAIEQAAQGALVEIEQALGVVIRQVAASRNVNLVMPRPLVIFNDPAFDLTEEVSQQFNRVLRSVTIPPEPTGAAPAPGAPATPANGAPAAPPPAPSAAAPARPAAPTPTPPRR